MLSNANVKLLKAQANIPNKHFSHKPAEELALSGSKG